MHKQSRVIANFKFFCGDLRACAYKHLLIVKTIVLISMVFVLDLIRRWVRRNFGTARLGRGAGK